MHGLTDQGATRLDAIARRNGVGVEAARAALDALARGGGTQAQFSHPELGGMGQWSRGGMIMIGDMFNSDLKARVAQLCVDLSHLLDDKDLFEAPKENAKAPHEYGTSSEAWWPGDFGSAAARGSQNNMRYAYFPAARRLAIDHGGTVSVYDTGSHQISGVSQQQSAGQDLTFTSQLGEVALHDLERCDDTERSSREPTAPAATTPHASSGPSEAATTASDDAIATLERLHTLQQKGILSEAEFAEKKKEILGRL